MMETRGKTGKLKRRSYLNLERLQAGPPPPPPVPVVDQDFHTTMTRLGKVQRAPPHMPTRHTVPGTTNFVGASPLHSNPMPHLSPVHEGFGCVGGQSPFHQQHLSQGNLSQGNLLQENMTFSGGPPTVPFNQPGPSIEMNQDFHATMSRLGNKQLAPPSLAPSFAPIAFAQPSRESPGGQSPFNSSQQSQGSQFQQHASQNLSQENMTFSGGSPAIPVNPSAVDQNFHETMTRLGNVQLAQPSLAQTSFAPPAFPQPQSIAAATSQNPFGTSSGLAGTPIETLMCSRISAMDINCLKAAGIFTMDAILFKPLKNLIMIPGLTEDKAKYISKAAYKILPTGFQSASATYQARREIVQITTGSRQLDALLGNGLDTGTVYCFFGEARVGKTRLCHTVCITSQLPISMGGAEGKALFIDCESRFRPETLFKIAEKHGINSSEALDQIGFVRVYNTQQLWNIVNYEVPKKLNESRYGVIVVDGILTCPRVEYNGRGELAERQQTIGQIIKKLKDIAEERGVAVVCTDRVHANVNANPMFPGAAYVPSGGFTLTHAFPILVEFRKKQSNERLAILYKDPKSAPLSATFHITDRGIED